MQVACTHREVVKETQVSPRGLKRVGGNDRKVWPEVCNTTAGPVRKVW